MSRIITFRLEEKTREKLESLCKSLGLTISDFVRQAVMRELMRESIDFNTVLTELLVRNQLDTIFLAKLFVQQDTAIRKIFTILNRLLKQIDGEQYKRQMKEIDERAKKLDEELTEELDKWKTVLFYLANRDFKGLKDYLERLRYPLRRHGGN